MTVAVPPRREHRERLLCGRLQPDGLERVVHAAARELLDLLDRVAVRRVDEVGRAEFVGQRQLLRDHVDRDRPRAAPAIAAPWMQLSPMPPPPITATVEPGSTLAVLNTAPSPVVTPQPMSAARSSGMSLSIFTSACSCTSICSAKLDRSKNWCTGVPSWCRRGGCRRAHAAVSDLFEHSDRWPVRQCSQLPQYTDRHVITWSPGCDVRDLVADRLDDAGGLVAEHRRGMRRGTCPP